MATVSSFYDGQVDEVLWSRGIVRASASYYGVDGYTDWRVTAGTGDRQVNIGSGTGWGKGVVDVTDTSTTLPSLAPATSGSRWDLIVMRRTWSTNTSAFAVVQGSATKGLPARQVGFGTVDDQPLALVQVNAGSTRVGTIIDLRCWASNSGLVAADELALQYLNTIGTSVLIGSIRHDRVLKGSTPTWVKSVTGGVLVYDRTSGYREPTTSNGTISTIQIPDPGFPYHIVAQAIVEAAGGGSGTRWDPMITIPGHTLTIGRGDAQAPWFDLYGQTVVPQTGSKTVTLSAVRRHGTGAFGVSSYNQQFRVTVLPTVQ